MSKSRASPKKSSTAMPPSLLDDMWPGSCRHTPYSHEDVDVLSHRSETPFVMAINGTINGEAFTVEGRGCGNSLKGNMKGKWVCTSGKLPIAWAALGPLLGYGGLKAYTYYPNGIIHFFQECFPEGYSQERVARYHNDGTLKSYHEITYNKGIIMNKVTVQGDGFKKDSPVLNNFIKVSNPVTECTYPYENGIRSMAHYVFPLKSPSEGFVVAEQMTVNRPLAPDVVIKQPRYHFTRSDVRQSTDVDEEADHIIQEGVCQAFELKLLCPFRNCGLGSLASS